MAGILKSEKRIERIHNMLVSSVYPLYIQKAEKKGRTKKEVDQIISWLTGYTNEDVNYYLDINASFEAFFTNAKNYNINANKITGLICGYRVEDIEDKIEQKVRQLDKLIDELARGRDMEKILRK